ncbi:biotin synthesis protein BioG [Nicoletella semolina]|uniref:Biotin synthesis protein BioG n=1 Tax=Nicoletella semolina TaxID=271160 RepID=A0A4R2N8B9_9PAST|nr:pimeloyl-ACP methyl esterase BioG family protein [Nicoletella semolina]MDH2923846.1 hypothetical protein [Nicoletella semolina]TCP17158.1 biotin synthesis protein BioG [Nicoletella semolina]
MNIQFFSNNQPNLIVFFAGWSVSPSIVTHLKLPSNYDLLICYNYAEMNLDFDFSVYDAVHLVAWSMGVWVAERVMQSIPIKTATAVNGTGFPIDDRFGIPCDIFTGTLANLDNITRSKFEFRMCGSKENFNQYQRLVNPRTLADIRQELAILYERIKSDRRTDLINWSNAIISRQDRIFNPCNQLNYWKQRSSVQLTDGEHYLFPQFTSWKQLWQ